MLLSSGITTPAKAGLVRVAMRPAKRARRLLARRRRAKVRILVVQDPAPFAPVAVGRDVLLKRR